MNHRSKSFYICVEKGEINSLAFGGNHAKDGVLIKTLSFQSPKLTGVSKGMYYAPICNNCPNLQELPQL